MTKITLIKSPSEKIQVGNLEVGDWFISDHNDDIDIYFVVTDQNGNRSAVSTSGMTLPPCDHMKVTPLKNVEIKYASF